MSLLARAETVARAVRDAAGATSVEVVLHRPEVSLGVPVLEVEVRIERPLPSAAAPTPVVPAATPEPAPAPAPSPSRSGTDFDAVLDGRGGAASVVPGTLAGITGGALSAGSAGGAPAAPAVAASAARTPDQGATVRTPHPGAADEPEDLGPEDLEPDDGAPEDVGPEAAEPAGDDGDDAVDDAQPDGGWGVTSSTAAAAPDVVQEHPSEHVADEPVHVEPEPDESRADGAADERPLVEPDLVPLGATLVAGGGGVPVSPGEPASEPEPPANATDGDDEPDGADAAAAAPAPAVAPQPRRPSAEAPLPARLVLSSRGDAARADLAGALRELRAAAGLDVGDVSPLARTSTAGGDLHSAVVAVTTTLGPRELTSFLEGLRAVRDGVDAEILTVGDLVGVHDDVELPCREPPRARPCSSRGRTSTRRRSCRAWAAAPSSCSPRPRPTARPCAGSPSTGSSDGAGGADLMDRTRPSTLAVLAVVAGCVTVLAVRWADRAGWLVPAAPSRSCCCSPSPRWCSSSADACGASSPGARRWTPWPPPASRRWR
ncbi:hypothetical protein [Litorihabitans aurantiacus]|uniref:Uncharacterized protein n=1 Tax=Litorihabitans aurantiacus TaxID=1930061 RepID=A0AA37XFN8_9MICO|nr:hypothetical protein [Litorihabitans aurantiacus]GMA32447.1 hypothetical protein GCM10025875_24390 [Litorihabitans aurantiacus]